MGSLTSKYNHNYRTVEVENAAKELKEFNEELVKLVDEPEKPCTYVDAFKEKINSLEYYKDHKYRKDAVWGFEVITTFSKDDNMDINMWKGKNVEWLNKTFNIAHDGKPNVRSVMYHADEAGNTHCYCHTYAIQIRDRMIPNPWELSSKF